MTPAAIRLRCAQLALVLVWVGACDQQVVSRGQLTLLFNWGELTPPTTEDGLFVWARVEERDPDSPSLAGSVLRETDIVDWRTEGVSLQLNDIPNGSNRMVIVEFKTAASKDPRDPTRYYGQSELFQLEPGIDRIVEVPFSLFAVPDAADTLEGTVVIVEAEELLGTGQFFVGDPIVTLSLAKSDAAQIEVANDPVFSRNLQAASLTDLPNETLMELNGRLYWPSWDLDAGVCGDDTGVECVDGPRAVFVRYRDAFGNESQGYEARVNIDSKPPQLVSSFFERCDERTEARVNGLPNRIWIKNDLECFFAPEPAECPDQGEPIEGTVQVQFAFDEPIDVDSLLVTVVGGGAFQIAKCQDQDLRAATFLTAVYTPDGTEVEFGSTADAGRVLATFTDIAGNRVLDQELGWLQVDSIAPDSPDVERDGCILYRREPWGDVDSPEIARFTVAVEDTCQDGSGPIAVVEPEVDVIFFDAKDVSNAEGDLIAGEIGKTRADANGQFGQPEPFELKGTDRSRVYVAVQDAAGNYSDADGDALNGVQAVPVLTIQWKATMGQKEVGHIVTNPNRLELRSALTSTLTGISEEEAGLPMEAALRGAPRPTWLATPDAPGALSYHSMAFDTARARLVMLDRDGHTWEWDGYRWLERCTDESGCVGPDAGTTRPMAYDRVRQRLVVLGGFLFSAAKTWEWDGEKWHVECDASAGCSPSPSARQGYAMAYDPQRARVLLFGGHDTTYTDNDELWEWDGVGWRMLCGGTTGCAGPSARRQATLTYDVARQRLLLFGGQTDGTYANDTWEWSGSGWRLACDGIGACSSGIAANRGATMVYDATRKVVVRHGEDASFNAATWEWDGVAWKVQHGPVDPWGDVPQNVRFAMAFDEASGKVVVYGGGAYGAHADMWTWDGKAWQLICDLSDCSASPDLLYDGAFAYDRERKVIVMHGGLTASDPSDQTWEWDADRWRLVDEGGPPASPGARYGQAMAYDPGRRVVVLFGSNSYNNDTWEWDGAAWNLACDGSDPCASSISGRYHLAMEYDPNLGAILLFGGDTGPGYNDETWAWNGSTWQAPCGTPTGCDPKPPSRSNHRMAYDPTRGRVVLFGGYGPAGSPPTQSLDDTWEWDGSGWELVCGGATSCSGPVGRQGFGMTFDHDRAKVVLYGGEVDTRPTGDVWEWDGSTWEPVCGITNACDAALGLRSSHDMEFHIDSGKTLVQGGYPNLGSVSAPQVWTSAKEKPATLFEVWLERAEGPSPRMCSNRHDCPFEWLDVMWRGTSTARVGGVDLAGSALLVWDQRWKKVAARHVETSQPQPASTLTWRTTDPQQLGRLFGGKETTLAIAATPEARNNADWSEIRTEYFEAEVRYRLGFECGDGVIAGGESCDDGNTEGGDECPADCGVEPPVCRDHTVQFGEECDDGNEIDGDGCDTNCTTTACGNGIVTAGEECDDGNSNDGDGCSAACMLQPTSCDNAINATAHINAVHVFGSTADGAHNNQSAMCVDSSVSESPERVYYVTPSHSGLLCVSTQHPGTIFDTVVSVRRDCAFPSTELSCNDDSMGPMAEVDVSVLAGETYYILVDGFAGSAGDFELSLELDYEIAAPGSAVMLSGSVDTTDPLYSRTDETCHNPSAGQHYYDTFHVTNRTNAAQLLTVTARWAANGYLHVYAPPWDPQRPLGSCLAGNDDDASGSLGSQITDVPIAPGASVIIVASTFSASTPVGAYELEVATQL